MRARLVKNPEGLGYLVRVELPSGRIFSTPIIRLEGLTRKDLQAYDFIAQAVDQSLIENDYNLEEKVVKALLWLRNKLVENETTLARVESKLDDVLTILNGGS